MKKLTEDKIQEYSKRINVDKKAVEKFLSSIDESLGKSGNIMKAEKEKDLFNWNASTINTIREGIDYMYYDY